MTGRRVLRWTEYALLTIGLACVSIFVLWRAQDWIYQSYQSYALDQRLRNEPATITGYLKHITGIENPPPPQTAEQVKPEPPPAPPPREVLVVPPGGLVGRIEIPRINISAIVREGVEEKVLRKAAGHIPDTPFPGQPGNVGLAAHRDQHFRNLRGIRKGDIIRMVTPFATYEYEVDSLKIVWPRNIEVLDPTLEPVITLVTCYPFNYVGNAPKRFIVRAKQTSVQTASAPRKILKSKS